MELELELGTGGGDPVSRVAALRAAVDQVLGWGAPGVATTGPDGITDGAVGEDVLRRVIAGLQGVISAATAAQTSAIAAYAAFDDVRGSDGLFTRRSLGVGYVNEFAGDDLAPVLGMAPSMATRRVHLAAVLAADLPTTSAAVGRGDLDPFRAQIVAEEVLFATPDVRARVEAAVFPAALGCPPGALRRCVRAALAQADPGAVAAAGARARAGRFVLRREGQVPGVSEWWAQLPSEDSARCWAAINALAARDQAGDPTKGIDACRADALVDLVLGNATIETVLQVAVPVDLLAAPAAPAALDGSAVPAALDGSAGPAVPDVSAGRPPSLPHTGAVPPGGHAWGGCLVPGVGVIPGEVLRRLAGAVDTTIIRLLVDARTGVLVGTGSTSYRPPASIRAYVRSRDGTCRFPGCRVAATRCDLDHVVPWPTGATRPDNLIALCRHHHRLKTHTRWSPVLHPDAAVTWTDPSGDSWRTLPVDHLLTAVA